MTTNKALPHSRHKQLLKKRGWSYRTAAPVLDVHWTHLYRVLKGTRHSKALLARIEALPEKGAAK